MRAVWGEAAHTGSDPLPQQCDDVVVGAGVTGLVTALALARAGREVCVLEARRPGAGATGRSTAKFSLLQGTRLQQVLRRQPHEVAQAYVEANRGGLDWLRTFCTDQGVPIQTRVAATFARSPEELATVRREHEAALALGLDVGWEDGPVEGVPSWGAVTLADQSQVDPVHLVQKLVAAVRAAGGRVVESARVRRLSPDGHTVHLEGGERVRTRTVVVASGAPVIDRGLQTTQMTAVRSYTLAHRWDGELTHMALSAGSDGRSIRDAVGPEGERLLLVGGAGHVVGRATHESEHVERLRRWTAEHFPDAVEVAAWSAQDHQPTTGVPLVGRMPLTGGTVRLATGFAKWGFTNGTAAGLAMAGDILGDGPLGHPGAYLGARPQPVQWARHNATVGLRMVRDAASVALPRPQGDVGVADVAHGCGICPHMGGVLRWNDAEETWDCPLHGSRFAPDGSVLEGPARRPARVPQPLVSNSTKEGTTMPRDDKNEKLSQDLDTPRERGTEPETEMGATPGENFEHASDQPVDETGGRVEQGDEQEAATPSDGQVSDPMANPTPPVQEPMTTPGVEDTPQTPPDQKH